MKTIDHLMLGRRLLAQYGAGASKLHRRAFLLGCVEPDYNLLSYLRGLRRHKKFHGHNAENAAAFLSRCTALLDRRAVFTAWDCFRLGTLLHYAADAFTAPHNAFWRGGLRGHMDYERALHRRFSAALSAWQLEPEPAGCTDLPTLHARYCAAAHCPDADCRCILAVCAALLRRYLPHTAWAQPKKGGLSLENTDHLRLVSAGR